MKVRRSFFAKLFSATSGEVSGETGAENSSEGFPWREFGRHYRKAIVWILVLTAVVHVMEVSGVLKGFEMAGLDTFLRLNARQMSQRVVIVEITDEDYRNTQLFDSKSPLKNDQLIKLVSAVRSYHPAAIGMDFDTASQDWCSADQSAVAQLLSPASGAPIIWAEVPDNIEEPLKLAPVLGGRLRDVEYVGVPRFPVDSDGLVRRYESEFRITGALEDCPKQVTADVPRKLERSQEISTTQRGGISDVRSDNERMPSFARAVLHQACVDTQLGCSSLHQEFDRPVIFNFYGDRYRFPIIQAHEFIGSADASSVDQNLHDRREALLRDKIVLIGGNFKAARDVYLTPLGEMAGVELIALAIESDFGGGIRETSKWPEKLADIFVGSLIVLVYFYYRRRPRFALLVSLVGVPLVATAFSLLLFRTAAYWFNFMPIIIGMVMHQMLELSESCGDLQKEVQDLEHQLHACRESGSSSEPPRREPAGQANDSIPTEGNNSSEEKKSPAGEQ